MKYDAPQLDSRYQNFIGGEWTEPRSGKYFENPSPVNGQAFCEVPRSGADDIELALDAAHRAAPAWGRTKRREKILLGNGRR